ncbi:MAG: hypothetical protein CMO80_22880 [Verrucomicrobiales bacterium]|nr:hypothetical protein [Verrucomicrobiales bacterium]
MEHKVNFVWTEQLCIAAHKASVKATLGRMWLVLLGGLMFTAIGIFEFQSVGKERSLYMGLFLIAVYTFRTLSDRRNLRDWFRLLGESGIRVSFDRQSFVILERENRFAVEWAQLTRTRRVDGFLLLFSRSVLFATLPEKFFTPDQIAFMEESVRQKATTDKPA